jgi:plasmid maintenance system antidote protein VapI
MTSKSPITTAKLQTKLPPVHPGEILKEMLGDLELSMNRLAQEIHVPANRISGIVAGQRSISGETARDVFESRIQSEIRPRSAA